MGTVALVGLGAHGRDRGIAGPGGGGWSSCSWCDPGLAPALGSRSRCCATAGISCSAPAGATRWLAGCPRWLAEAVAVPLAAQLACTPLVAAISGQVSLVAVGANLLAAPAVGPATVLGLLGGCLRVVLPPAGRLVGTCAGWCVALDRPGGAARCGPARAGGRAGGRSGGPGRAHRSLPRGGGDRPPPGGAADVRAGGVVLVLVAAVLVRVPTPGWPPAGWLWWPATSGRATRWCWRPDSRTRRWSSTRARTRALMDGCLDGLGVSRVPLVVLTHFHADHVDGLAGVLAGRSVGEVDVSRLLDPPEGGRWSVRHAARAGLTPRGGALTPSRDASATDPRAGVAAAELTDRRTGRRQHRQQRQRRPGGPDRGRHVLPRRRHRA